MQEYDIELTKRIKKMKILSQSILALAVIGFANNFAFSQAKDTVQIHTSSICDMCKRTIEKDLAFEKGVIYSDLDLETNVVTVVYKTKQTDPQKIRVRLNEIGYDADSLKAYPLAVDRLAECCKPNNPFHVDDKDDH